MQKALAASYAPVKVDCPSDVQWIRPANGLSPDEAEWVFGRKQVVSTALAAYLDRLNLTDFDLAKYLDSLQNSNYSSVPTLGLAISGGGTASGFTGTGMVRALDDRLPAAVEQRTGGLLQSTTYFSGLSGGAFPVVGFSTNNFPTADEIIDLWKPEIARLEGVNKTTENAATPDDIFKEIAAKAKAGFDVTASDYLGLAYGYEFVTGYKGGLNVTWSGVRNLSNFTSHEMPMPILHTSELDNGDLEYFGIKIPFLNSTVVSVARARTIPRRLLMIENSWKSIPSSLAHGMVRLEPSPQRNGLGPR